MLTPLAGTGVDRPDLLSSDTLPLLDVAAAVSVSFEAPPMLGLAAGFGAGLDVEVEAAVVGGGTNLVRF